MHMFVTKPAPVCADLPSAPRSLFVPKWSLADGSVGNWAMMSSMQLGLLLQGSLTVCPPFALVRGNGITINQGVSIHQVNDGKPTHSIPRVTYRSASCIHSAESPNQRYTTGALTGVQLIPIAPPNLAVIYSDCGGYKKTPNVSGLDGSDNITVWVLQERKTCEAICDGPHLKLVTYYGYGLARA